MEACVNIVECEYVLVKENISIRCVDYVHKTNL